MPTDFPPTDFFSSPLTSSDSTLANQESTDSFAKAIETRFDSISVPLFTATLLNPPQPSTPAFFSLIPPSTKVQAVSTTVPSSPTSSRTSVSHPTTSSPTSSNFIPQLPVDLDFLINDPTCLILDIRPNAAFSSARLPRAVSLSVPSTLLKRPLFSLTKLAEMLPSKSCRAKFSDWSKASTILVYDADSSLIPENSNVNGLLRKFRNEGFPPDRSLVWLKGGFVSVWRERSDLVVSGPEQIDEDEEEHDTLNKLSLSSSPIPADHSSVLRMNLPISAFTLSSTTSQRPKSSGAQHPPSLLPHPDYLSLLGKPDLVSSSNSSQPLTMPFNPFYDTVRQNIELSHGISERIPLTLPSSVLGRVSDLPFSWLRHIARRAAPAENDYTPSIISPVTATPDLSVSSDDSSLSDNERPTPITAPSEELVEEGAEALAMQFYRIELGEQRRLMGIMQHHSQESGCVIHPDPSLFSEAAHNPAKSSKNASLFPYSITAGVEKGSKNRYRNIWPFEHARVKLNKQTRSDDDYINASFVQPLGTSKRYIATQGPLEATLTDFWTLVWEQNVHVIVMLTKEVEGMQVKCANYWDSRQYGPLVLTLIESSETKEQEAKRIGKEGWSWVPPKVVSSSPSTSPSPPRTIKRRLELRHTRYPQAEVRRITQLQYLEWPDLNVPEDPRGLLELASEVHREVEQALDSDSSTSSFDFAGGKEGIDKSTGIMRHARENPPLLLHCSAGVGRTGGFIAVDAILDGLRREVQKKREQRKKRRMTQFKRQAEENDVVMQEVQSSSNDNDMLVNDDDGKRASFHGPNSLSSLVMPLSGGGEGEFVVHVPVVGWSDATGQHGSCSSSSEKGSPDPDRPPSQMHVDPHSSLRHKKRPGLNHTSPWISTREELKEWINNEVPPQPARDDLRHKLGSSSSGRSSREAGLASASGSRSSSMFGSKNSSDVNLSKGSDAVVTSSSLRRNISPSRFSSAEPFSDGYGLDIRSSPSVSIAPSPPSSISLTLSSASEGNSGDSQKSSLSYPRASSPLSSSAAGSSIFDSLPLLESTTTFSSSIDLKLKQNSSSGAVESSSSNSRSNSLQSSSLSEIDGANSSRKFNIQSSSSVPNPNTANESPDPSAVDNHAQAFDYTHPRALHDDRSPFLLSTFDEPIRRVVEDMREQRMSLCQSLRQYVFVHRAIIEGALMIVDEERERGRMESGLMGMMDTETDPGRSDVDVTAPTSPEANANTISSSSTAIPSRGKRIASPTELIKENKRGQPVLSKRPSMKRKQMSDDDAQEKTSWPAVPFPLLPPAPNLRL